MKCFVCKNEKKFKKLFPRYCFVKNYICEVCGLIQVERGKTSMQKYYKQDGYFRKSPNLSLRKEFLSRKMLIKTAKERVNESLAILSVPFKGKNILDVGCGYGELLYYIKDRFQGNVVGIEASKEAARIGEQMFDLPIYPLLLENFKFKEKFDVIICAHTLEHVDDPNLFLQGIRRLLKKDGYLYIEVPNILKPTGGFSLEKFLYSEHLQNFSAYSLNLILANNGFKTVSYSDTGFLKFWCRLDSRKRLVINKISAEQILDFLEKYKNNYTFINTAKVYVQKFNYLRQLLFYKLTEL